MSGHSLSNSTPILLVGAGPASPQLVTKVFVHADSVIAVDGGLTAVRAAGLNADAVLGDFDSASDLGDTPQIHLPDQNYTDFQKALRAVQAPVILGVGFLGGRLDHQLAAFTALLQDPRPVVLVSEGEVCFIAPPDFTMSLPDGTPVSAYPLRACIGGIEGVRYPLYNVPMDPAGQISTSNTVTGTPVIVRSDARALLVILPVAVLGLVISALTLAMLPAPSDPQSSL